jgi:hypothetical protein
MPRRVPWRRLGVLALVGAAGVALLAGCRRTGAATVRDGPPVMDTLRGLVAVTGSEPLTTVQLTTATGDGWHLVGDSLDAVRAAAGLEIMVRGVVLAPDRTSRPSARLDAVRFVVRSADGIAAQDGVLERDGAGFALRLADGRLLTLTDVPVTLREQIGARIWWAGRLDRAPVAYGVLIARR